MTNNEHRTHDSKTDLVREIYEKDLKPALNNLEDERIFVANLNVAFYLLALGVIVLFFILIRYNPNFSDAISESFLLYAIPVVLFFLGFDFIKEKIARKYSSKFKSEVVKILIEKVFPHLTFSAERGILMEEYLNTQLFTIHPDIYGSEDWVGGKVGNTTIQFSEVYSAYTTTTTDSKGNTETETHTIFRGIMLQAEFNKNIFGRSFVLPDIAEKTFGKWLGGALQSASASLQSRGDIVKLENPDFEKLFVVTSDDQVEARYILTPVLMERLTYLSSRLNCVPHVSFIGNHANFALPISGNFFEPRIYSTGLNIDDMNHFVEIVDSVVTIIEDLDLNTRIWSKA